MQRIDVSLADRSYPILIGSDLHQSQQLLALCADRQVAIVTDLNVAALYSELLIKQIKPCAKEVLNIVLPGGESTKHLDSVNSIITQLLERRFDRRALIIALGGGVVGDMAGFAAALYQRGIDFVQMPTTLLAMVDSSVGGKTGVNHALGKNMIGAFHQPKLVIANINWLATLPTREVSAGLAEIIKHGAIKDPVYLAEIAKQMSSLRRLDVGVLAAIVARSCEIKSEVVSADEREGGVRAILNFGHTFGHAIEAGLGYGEWLHGEAVGAGMVMAAALSVQLGHLKPEAAAMLTETIAAACLPTRGPDWPTERYQELMSIDKKADQGTPKFILLNGLGNAIIRQAPDSAVQTAIRACI